MFRDNQKHWRNITAVIARITKPALMLVLLGLLALSGASHSSVQASSFAADR